MSRLILAILLIAPFAFAISNDASCIEFCKKCAEEQSELCTEIIETCQCNVPNEPANSDVENSQAEESEAASETAEPASNTPIMKASFAPPPEKKKENDGAIMNVNFGYKGDSEYTAKLKSDGSYELEEKSNTGVWVAIGTGALVVLLLIIASAL